MKSYEKYLSEKVKNERARIWKCIPSILGTCKEFQVNEVYPHFFALLKIVSTLPISAASCERANSKLKLINSYLRCSMNSERVEDLVIIGSEKDYADRISLDHLVDAFKLSSNRKLML